MITKEQKENFYDTYKPLIRVHLKDIDLEFGEIEPNNEDTKFVFNQFNSSEDSYTIGAILTDTYEYNDFGVLIESIMQKKVKLRGEVRYFDFDKGRGMWEFIDEREEIPIHINFEEGIFLFYNYFKAFYEYIKKFQKEEINLEWFNEFENNLNNLLSLYVTLKEKFKEYKVENL